MRKHEGGEIPPLVSVRTHDRVETPSHCCTSIASRSCPVVSAGDRTAVVGSIGERGLLRHAVDDPALLASEVIDVMEAPFPAVSIHDDVREAVELLAGDRQALLVTDDGRPVGIVTRTDLLEALAR